MTYDPKKPLRLLLIEPPRPEPLDEYDAYMQWLADERDERDARAEEQERLQAEYEEHLEAEEQAWCEWMANAEPDEPEPWELCDEEGDLGPEPDIDSDEWDAEEWEEFHRVMERD